jgi:septal ring factor EnvC (AmiA/AmiB activator)
MMLLLKSKQKQFMKNKLRNLGKSKLRLFFVGVFFASLALMPLVQADRYSDEIAELEQINDQQESHVHELLVLANGIEEAISELQAHINRLQVKIEENKARSAQLKVEIAEAEEELAYQKDVLGQNIKAMYLEGQISTLEMLATSKDLSQFVDKQQYRDVVKSKIKEQVDLITELRLKLQAQREEVEELIKQDQQLRAEVAEQKAEQNRLLSLNQAEQNAYNQKIAANNEKIKELRAAQAALYAALNSGRYKTAPAGPVNGGDIIGNVGNTGLSSGAHLHLEVRVGGGVTNPNPYIRHNPVRNSYVTQPYGWPDPIYISGYHPGIDYSYGDGAVRAIDGGMLYRGCSNDLLGTSNNAYGYVGIVEHPGGHISVYGHMAGGPPACDYNTYY